MAPRFYNNPPSNPNTWWENAWKGHEYIIPQFEFKAGRDMVRPGQLIRIKGKQGTFKFRCLATNTRQDVTWIECVETKTGHFRAFHIEEFKSIVKPKKSRRKKPIE